MEARARAAELAVLYQGGEHDLHGYVEMQRVNAERERQANNAAARQALEETQHTTTVGQLLNTYVEHLKRSDAQCHGDVANLFKNHIFEADGGKDLVRQKAAAATVDNFVQIIGQVVDVGKGRTAGKLRSYVRAAYQLAISAKTNPGAPLMLRDFAISVNPIANISALTQFNRTRHRVLNANELSSFLKRIEALNAGEKKDALTLCIHLGGQRPAQLLRARCVDLNLPAATLTLYDPKGARREPRAHILPLTPAAARAAQRRMEASQSFGRRLLFSTQAEMAMHPGTLTRMVRKISQQMVEVGEAVEDFELRDIRRTIETMLAALRIPKDIRGQVQSHGLGGVQSRHYDRHEYILEKREALELWSAYIERLKSKDSSGLHSSPPLMITTAPVSLT
jgi:integrase